MKKETFVERIDILTSEQKAAMPAYRDMWIAKGLQTGETDWDTFDKYMPICYEKAGFVYPKRVVRVQSPLVGALASSIANAILKKGNGAVENAIDFAGSGLVGLAIARSVHSLSTYEADSTVDDAVSRAVRVAVGVAVGDAVRDAVDGAVGVAVDGAVGVAVGDAVDGAVGVAVQTSITIAHKAGISIDWHNWLGGQLWVGGWYWGVAFANFFFDVCKLKLSTDIMERALAYRKVCESVNYIWPNRNFVMVCARPMKIERNEHGRLHSTSGMAIQYPDGWGLYFLNGVRFDEALFKKVTSGKMPFTEILAITDIDQRTQAMRFGDVWEFVKYAKGIELDKCAKERQDGSKVKYWLYKFPAGDIFTQDAYYAIYDDLVPGTGKQYMSGVQPCKTVAEAMAWKFSDEDYTLTPAEWLTLEPGITMN